jgi:hypothetical protein
MGKVRLLRRMFVTDDGRLALLWRLVGFILLFGACLWLRGRLHSFLESRALQLGAGTFGFALVELMVAVVVIGATIGLTFMFRRFVDRRSWAGMAMPAPWRRGGDIALGLGLGAAMMLAVFAIEYRTERGL